MQLKSNLLISVLVTDDIQCFFAVYHLQNLERETFGSHLVLQIFDIDIDNQTIVMSRKVIWRE